MSVSMVYMYQPQALSCNNQHQILFSPSEAEQSRLSMTTPTGLSQELINGLRQYFDNGAITYFKYENYIDGGVQGGTFKLQYTGPLPYPFRRIVVKVPNEYGPIFPYLPPPDQEYNVLKSFVGSVHMVQAIVVSSPRPYTGPLAQTVAPPDKWAVMEWLENGTLKKLIDQSQAHGIQLPNRLLWSLLLCMVRMCIALAYPEAPRDINRIETIPSGLPQRVVENFDMHTGNMMFGDFDGTVEHKLCPVLKMIDLGMAGWKYITRPGLWHEISKDHITRVGNAMVTLMEAGGRDECTFHVESTLDQELVTLVSNCGKEDPSLIPKLPDLAWTVYNNVVVRPASYYAAFPTAEDETDEAIRNLVRRLLLNADASVAPQPDSRARL